MALGIMISSLYALLISQADGPLLFLIASVAGGAGWSLAGGSVVNFALERIPHNRRPVYLAWYNIAFQSGILMGALVAPALADQVWGLTGGLIFATGCRLGMGLVVLRTREPSAERGARP